MAKKPSRKLPPEIRERYRQICQSQQASKELGELCIERRLEESLSRDQELLRDLLRSIGSRELGYNLDRVFASCESPIEKQFFASLVIHFTKHEVLSFRIMPPSKDVEADLEYNRDFSEKLFQAYLFYNNIPDSVRPDTFEEFVRISSGGEVPEDEITTMGGRAQFELDFGCHHSVHLVLQPTFSKIRVQNRKVRTDALIFVPSDPTVRIVIECDGFDYHSDRDKFRNDRERDRIFMDAGYTVRRYSGSEIHENPFDASYDLYSYLLDNLDCLTVEYREKWLQKFKADHAERIAYKGQWDKRKRKEPLVN